MKKIMHSILFLLLALMVTGTATADMIKAATLSKKEFKTLLTEVLKENPEILFEVMKENDAAFIETITTASETARTNELENQWQKDLKNEKKFSADKRPKLGPQNAPNTLYIFSDFLCSYCQKTASIVEAFVKEHKEVNLVFKAFPKNEESKIALRWFYLMNQKDSKKAWQLHDTIFMHQQAYAASPIAVLKEIVRQQGFDPEKFVQEVDSKKSELNALIDEDIQEAKKYHVEGTPYMFINNIVLIGSQNLTTLESALKYSLK